MTTYLHRCYLRNCVYYRGATPEGVFVCYAFPSGIPDEITIGDNLHLTSFDSDDDIVYKAGEEVVEKGGPGSGHHGHRGRPGKVGGGLPDNAAPNDIMTNDEVYELQKRINIATYDKAQKVQHGRELSDAMMNAPYRTREEFAAQFVDNNPVPRASGKAKQWDPEYVLDGVRKVIQQYGGRAESVIEGKVLEQQTGLNERDLDFVWSKHMRDWMSQERTHGLYQFRVNTTRGYVFDKDNGIVTVHEALGKALREFGYRKPEKLYDYLINLPVEEKQYEDTATIAFDLSDEDGLLEFQKRFPGEKVSPLHISLMFLGNKQDLDKDTVISKISSIASAHAPIAGKFNGIAKFEGEEGKFPIVLLFDSPELPGFQRVIRYAFEEIEQQHGFTAHATMCYSDSWDDIDDVADQFTTYPVLLDKVWLYWGDEYISFPLSGQAVEKQLPINEESKKRLIEVRTQLFNNDTDKLATRIYTGEISIGQWEEQMRKLIREMHASTAAIGKGGWDQMTSADWGRLGPVLKREYQFLHGFSQRIADGKDTISLQAIEARAHLYGGTAGQSTTLTQAGHVIEMKLPWLPRDLSTRCGGNCCCRWDVQVIDTVGDYNLVQFTWHLGEAEHCEDCVKRDGFITVQRLHKSIELPDVIGDLCSE